uniref:Cystatin domain-containing protein n=1 Tax=Strongyloides papillosus TaxID=174720 RepID=A0A0N5C2X0_STREA
MKYLITSIILAIVIFAAINGNQSSSPKSPKWKKWRGNKTFPEEIARNATYLYNNETGENYKLVKVNSTFTRVINDTDRYKVKFCATNCTKKKQPKENTKDKIKKKSYSNYETNCDQFHAVLTVKNSTGHRRLTVTKDGTNTTYNSKKVSTTTLRPVSELPKKKKNRN